MTKIRTALAPAFLIITALAGFSGCVHTTNLIPKGWTVAIINGVPQDVEPTPNLNVSKLKLRSFLVEMGISGEEMRKRAVELKCNLGLSDGKRLLAEQDKIPAEFRGFYIPLTGTLLRDSVGNLNVPCLYFVVDVGRWMLTTGHLDNFWDGNGRLACSE